MKNKLPPFVPMLLDTMDSPAWRAMTYGARILYIALKRRHRKGRNTAYLSSRDAIREIGATSESIARWFDELQHYGFIVKVTEGCLGVDGKGKSPHWRLTELGQTKEVTPDGLPEPPTRDFQKWNGKKFKIPTGKLGHTARKIRTPVRGKLGRFIPKVTGKSGHIAGDECPKNPGITSYHSLADNLPPSVDAENSGGIFEGGK